MELKRPNGQGVLRLFSDNENLDEWYVSPEDCVSMLQLPNAHHYAGLCCPLRCVYRPACPLADCS